MRNGAGVAGRVSSKSAMVFTSSCSELRQFGIMRLRTQTQEVAILQTYNTESHTCSKGATGQFIRLPDIYHILSRVIVIPSTPRSSRQSPALAIPNACGEQCHGSGNLVAEPETPTSSGSDLARGVCVGIFSERAKWRITRA